MYYAIFFIVLQLAHAKLISQFCRVVQKQTIIAYLSKPAAEGVKMEWKIACLLIGVLSLASSAVCYPVLFSSCRSTGVNDDGSSTMSLSVPFRFYGRSYRSVRVSVTAIVIATQSGSFLDSIQMCANTFWAWLADQSEHSMTLAEEKGRVVEGGTREMTIQ